MLLLRAAESASRRGLRIRYFHQRQQVPVFDRFGLDFGPFDLTPLVGKERHAWPLLISGSWGSSSTKPLVLYLQVFNVV